MTAHRTRRAALSAAVLGSLVLTSGVAATAPAAGQVPVKYTYDCTAPGLGSQPLDFDLSSDAPATMYVGRAVTPNLTVVVAIPGFVLPIARFAGITQADATGEITVGVNGVPSVRNATFPRTVLPGGAEDFPVNLPVTLPRLTRSSVGTVTYTPGPIHATLNGYDKDGNDKGSIEADCVLASTAKPIATVTFVKSPTKGATAVARNKAKKRVTAATVLSATSGVAPTGKVTFALFKGTAKIRTVVANVASKKAVAVFTGISKKGAYKVVATYGGSAAHTGSKSSRSFIIR